METQKREARSIGRDEELNDCRIMIEYLPLHEEVLPSAAREVEEDIHDYMSKQASDDYVYDFYAVKEDASTIGTDSKIPLIQVDNDDYYDGPDNDSEYETDDSNAENNPLNEYPDEEETSQNEIEGEDEITSVSSSEEKSESHSSSGSHSERSERKAAVMHFVTTRRIPDCVSGLTLRMGSWKTRKNGLCG